MIEAAELLREKAREYELNKLAAEEREQLDMAMAWATVALTLHEVAAALELERAA